MARAGDEYRNEKAGQTLIFRTTSVDSGGELLAVESVYRPGSVEPVDHLHPRQEERFRILAGEMRARIDGEERTLATGEELTVSPGAVHAMWNDGPAEARISWETRPALETERFFEAVWGLAQEGKVNEKGVPNPLRMAVILRAHREEFRLAKPPGPIQDLVLAPLAAIGRLRGYRASSNAFT